MVRLAPSPTLMPEFAFNSQPSTRIRWASPVTVGRLVKVTLPQTTYQPSNVVAPGSKNFALAGIFCGVPLASRYVSPSGNGITEPPLLDGILPSGPTMIVPLLVKVPLIVP